MRLALAITVACMGLLAAAGAAHAAGTVVIDGGSVEFTAGAGVANDMTIATTANSVTLTDSADTINEAEGSCEGGGTNTVTCTLASEGVRLDLGDANDRLGASGARGVVVDGEAGSDRITTGDADDAVLGGADADVIATGAGEDIAVGQEGDGDAVDAGPGNDLVGLEAGDGAGDTNEGGPGHDRLSLGAEPLPPADLVVDLPAGTVGGTNAPSAAATGFEDVSAEGHATTTVRGTGGANDIDVGDSADTVDPGAGSDFVVTRGGNDRLLARDGFPDFVSCGGGADRAEVDQLDTTVACEDVASAFVRPAAAGGAPGCEVAVRQRIRRTALVRRGLRAAVDCASPAELEVRLVGTATRDGDIAAARAGDVVLAERRLRLAAGSRTVRLRVVRRLRKAIPPRARLRLEIVARDRFGNVQVITKRVRVTSPRSRSR